MPRRRPVYHLLLLIFAACPSQLGGCFVSDPFELLERRLKNSVEQQEDPRGLHFFCQIGGSYDALGIVTLQLSGNGRLLLSWRQEDEDDNMLWSVQLSDSDQKKFYKLLLTHPFWRTNPARRARRPDEINIHLRISDQHAGNQNAIQFWSNDLLHNPELSQLMVRLSRIMRTLSDDVLSFDELEKLHI